jgi:Tfp pilus assembly protein PilF
MACSSPEAKRERHLKRGQAYLEKSKLKEAEIELKKALRPIPAPHRGITG